MRLDHVEAYLCDGHVYCTEHLPKGFTPTNGEAQPIFAGSEWDRFPVCENCNEVHRYVQLTEEGKRTEGAQLRDVREVAKAVASWYRVRPRLTTEPEPLGVYLTGTKDQYLPGRHAPEWVLGMERALVEEYGLMDEWSRRFVQESLNYAIEYGMDAPGEINVKVSPLGAASWLANDPRRVRWVVDKVSSISTTVDLAKVLNDQAVDYCSTICEYLDDQVDSGLED